MFVEELSKIKECEDKAEKIRKDAKAKSVKSIEAAKAEAEKIGLSRFFILPGEVIS